MLTEPENSVVVAMRRAAATTHFDEHTVQIVRSRVRRRRAIAASVTGVGVILLCATTVGVVSGAQRDVNTNVTTAAEHVNLMVQTQPGNAYTAAQVSGTLVVTEGNCLALAVPTGGPQNPSEVRYAVYWAYGFTASRDTEGKAVLYDDEGKPTAREGDTISLGGGLLPENFEFPDRDHPCNVGSVWIAAPDVSAG